MNDSHDVGSLDSLRDIVELSPVSWWPPAPGWWILLALATALVCFAVWRFWRDWRRNAYRRAAIAELSSATSPAQIAAILKRTALVAYPRIDVASMTGTQWCDWLAKSSGAPVSSRASQQLISGVFQKEEVASLHELSEFATAWIHHHLDARFATEDICDAGTGRPTEC